MSTHEINWQLVANRLRELGSEHEQGAVRHTLMGSDDQIRHHGLLSDLFTGLADALEDGIKL